MKGKIIRGSSFRGLIKYLFGETKKSHIKNKAAQIIGGNMTGQTPAQLAEEFNFPQKTRKKLCRRPVLHIPLRMPDGQDVPPEKWRQIATRFMEKMGLGRNRPWLLVKHHDQHVHIATNRINFDGDLWHGKWEALELIKATNELEKEFDLTVTPTLLDCDHEKIRSSSGQIQKKARQSARGNEPDLTANEQLAELISQAIEQSEGSYENFERSLRDKKVIVHRFQSATGYVSGIVFEFSGVKIKGSKIARSYGWKGIAALLEKQKSAVQSAKIAPISVALPVTAAPETKAVPTSSVGGISPLPPPASVQTPRAAHAEIVTPKHEIIISEPPPVPTSPVVAPPAPVAPAILTLDQPDEKSWPAVQKTLVNQFRLDPIWINELHKRSLLWAVDENTLASARRSLATGKILGATVLPLNSDWLVPKVFAPDQQGVFFGFGKFADAKRVVVTANATEVISYYHLALSGNHLAPPGWVVSVDAQLPPAWLVDEIIKSKKRLLLATKTELSDREIAKALPQLVVPGTDKFHDWFERDSSLAKSWNALLIEQLKIPGQIKTKGMPR